MFTQSPVNHLLMQAVWSFLTANRSLGITCICSSLANTVTHATGFKNTMPTVLEPVAPQNNMLSKEFQPVIITLKTAKL